MDKYEKIKELNIEQNKLIDNLKYAQQVENNEITHELKKEQKNDYFNNPERSYFYLIDIKKAKIVVNGHLPIIRSYCKIRNIKKEQIKYTGIINQ